ncbi:T9SS type A sorting domain-containing protein [Paracrocinitomix mangrovi]|uniref:T9SS type A sorting domain-containing protein n=1 Tax=Paracrocinitomix mangrovi TaxID=2862509 RepID=UPI001C8DE7CD|nr:T9SS type A sorting domain-containing protein [Paracrocinitomix mangrovi]UKN00576.1 T9SS type A sorting domain-containing protein [Paracrocinitomix mangrovi]
MKFLFSSFLLMSLSCFGQHFFQPNTSWHEKYVWHGNAGPGQGFWSYNDWYTDVVGDTIVGTDTFQVVQYERHFGMPANYITNETWYIQRDSNIVYYSSDLITKKMLYDFNMEVGDSLIKEVKFSYEGSGYDTLIVVQVDTINVNGVDRKRILFNDFSFYASPGFPNMYGKPMEWIEGIGDTIYGVIPFDATVNYIIDISGNQNVPCFIENGTTIFGDCDPLSVASISTFDWKVYPNPVNELLTVESPFSGEFKLFDAEGRLVGEWIVSAKDQINISHLNTGVYIGLLQANGVSSRQRIIIQ